MLDWSHKCTACSCCQDHCQAFHSRHLQLFQTLLYHTERRLSGWSWHTLTADFNTKMSSSSTHPIVVIVAVSLWLSICFKMVFKTILCIICKQREQLNIYIIVHEECWYSLKVYKTDDFLLSTGCSLIHISSVNRQLWWIIKAYWLQGCLLFIIAIINIQIKPLKCYVLLCGRIFLYVVWIYLCYCTNYWSEMWETAYFSFKANVKPLNWLSTASSATMREAEYEVSSEQSTDMSHITAADTNQNKNNRICSRLSNVFLSYDLPEHQVQTGHHLYLSLTHEWFITNHYRNLKHKIITSFINSVSLILCFYVSNS